MKKQKAPIVPILLVIMLLGWIGYSQLPKSPPKPPQTEQPKDTPKSEAEGVSKQFSDNKPKSPVKPELRMTLNSSLLKVDPAISKPKPNPTSTASQWYQPGADQTNGS